MSANGNGYKATEQRNTEARKKKAASEVEVWPKEVNFELHFEKGKVCGLAEIGGQGFFCGSVVKNLPANAGDMVSVPGQGKISHAMEQLSPCATTTEPVLQSPEAANH